MEELANTTTYKNYIFFWVGQLFSLLGSSVVFFAITWWIADFYVSAILLSIATFLSVLMITLFMPIAGVIADKVNKKTLIVVVDSSQAFATFLLIILFQFGLANIGMLFFFISIRSIFQAFHIPTVNSIIPTMVPRDKLSRINGINFLFTGVVQLFAPFIGALLLLFVSMHLLLWADIITFFIALIPLLLITIPSVKQLNHTKNDVGKNSFIKDFKIGLKTLKLVPGLIIMIVLSMLLNFLLTPANALMPLFIKINHGGGVGHLAIVEMTFTGGMITGAILTSVKKNWDNKIRTIFISIVIALIGYLIFAVAPSGSYVIMGIGGVILGFNLPIINSLYQTFLQLTVPPDKMGRVSSIDHTFSSAISPIGSLISGPISVIIGIQALFFFCGITGVLFTVVFWCFTGIRKVDIDSKSELEKINGRIENLVIE
ncbi:MAG: MFS transporter [Promethearchaeota archaeon]|jgi:DHA3 family macrolide efflux protein-like MFS transporter